MRGFCRQNGLIAETGLKISKNMPVIMKIFYIC